MSNKTFDLALTVIAFCQLQPILREERVNRLKTDLNRLDKLEEVEDQEKRIADLDTLLGDVLPFLEQREECSAVLDTLRSEMIRLATEIAVGDVTEPPRSYRRDS